jgi:predicted Zn-dependent protease
MRRLGIENLEQFAKERKLDVAGLETALLRISKDFLRRGRTITIEARPGAVKEAGHGLVCTLGGVHCVDSTCVARLRQTLPRVSGIIRCISQLSSRPYSS